MPNKSDYYPITQHSRSGFCPVCDRQENAGTQPSVKKSQMGWTSPEKK